LTVHDVVPRLAKSAQAARRSPRTLQAAWGVDSANVAGIRAVSPHPFDEDFSRREPFGVVVCKPRRFRYVARLRKSNSFDLRSETAVPLL